MSEELVVPRVHLNGTSKRELLSQIADASRAIAEAYDDLVAAFPNERDYYTYNDDMVTFHKAVEQAEARGEKLWGVKLELDAMFEQIYQQGRNNV